MAPLFLRLINYTDRPHPILALKHKPSKAFSDSKKEKRRRTSGASTNWVNLLGLEPSTYSLEGCRSIRMSYRSIDGKDNR